MIYTVSSHFFKKYNLSQLVSYVFILSFVYLQFNNFSFDNIQIQNETEDFYELNLEFDDSDDDDDSSTCTLATFNLTRLSFINFTVNVKAALLHTQTFQYSSRAPPIT